MTPGFNLHLSNNSQALYQQVYESLSVPLSSPLTKETIIIQNQGVKSWLTTQLAIDLGSLSNASFSYPKTYIHHLFSKLPDYPKLALFETPGMSWTLMKLLPILKGQGGFHHIADYVRNDPNGIKGFQFCRQMAKSFERYQIYNPQLLARWEQGEEHHWQAQLWRIYLHRYSNYSLPEFKMRLLQAIQDDPQSLALPERLTLFNLNSLPPFYLEIYKALASLTQVNVYQYTLDSEHPLWVQSGQINRDLMAELKSLATNTDAYKSAHEKANSLQILQAKIEGNDTSPTPLKPIDPSESLEPSASLDHSIQVHNCFSSMREVQVLHDQLLKILETDPSIAFNDIAIVTPTIEEYAPLIHAVFSSSTPYLPFTIMGQSVYQQSSLVHVLFSILSIRNSRWEASQVMSILNHPLVYRQFGFVESDLELVFQWVKEANIRWGQNKEHTRELGFSDMHINTWTFGLERLMLGYAMPLGEEELFENILPYDHVEGSSALLLGKLFSFIEALSQVYEQTQEPQKTLVWRNIIQGVLEQFFRPLDSQEQEVHLIRTALNQIEQDFRVSHFDLPIPLDVMEYELTRQLKDMPYPSRGFDGRITIGPVNLVGQRPLKVLCFLGLGDQDFPAKDRIEQYYTPESEDNPHELSQRNQDRHDFFHGLMHTQHHLYLSYVGQSIRDNQGNPPTLVITELLEFLTPSPEIKHPLHPYHSRYFNPSSELFSYSQNHFNIYQATKDSRLSLDPFFTDPLPPLPEEYKTIELHQLIRFFKDPVRAFIMDRLRIYTPDEIEGLEDKEPFGLDGLDNYLLYNELVAYALAGKNLNQMYDFIKASGKLPYATIGRILFEQMVVEAQQFAVSFKEQLVGEPLEPYTIDVVLDDFRLFGPLDQVYANGLCRYRYATIKAKDRMETWIRFLVLKALNPPDVKTEALFWAKSWEISFEASFDPLKHLKQLIDLYWLGMTRPLPLLSETSYAYARQLAKSGSPDDALKEARKKFDKDYQYNTYNQWCFDSELVETSQFAELAQAVYGPLYEAQQERKH